MLKKIVLHQLLLHQILICQEVFLQSYKGCEKGIFLMNHVAFYGCNICINLKMLFTFSTHIDLGKNNK